MKKDYLKIGKIVGTHGVRGMVRIDPWADDGAFLKNFKSFYLDDKTELKLANITPHKNIVIAKIAGVETIEQAEKFREAELSVLRSEVPKTPGRYYIEEILGATVKDKDTGAYLGKLTDVYKTGANDVWQVTNDGKDYLLPVIESLEIKVDLENNEITLKPLKGIFSDED